MSAEPRQTLQTMLNLLGFEATVAEYAVEDGLTLDITTGDPGRLIGRGGQTLAQLQYLLNRLIFQQDPDAPKVTVDVGGYRSKAREELIVRAKEAADKVRKWGDIVELEPMNAYDRRVVHQAIKDDADVESSSAEVDGTDKKVILLRPKRAR